MCNEVQSNDVVPLLLTTRSSKVANEETSFVAREPSIMPFSFISRDLQEDTHGYDSDSMPEVTTGNDLFIHYYK